MFSHFQYGEFYSEEVHCQVASDKNKKSHQLIDVPPRCQNYTFHLQLFEPITQFLEQYNVSTWNHYSALQYVIGFHCSDPVAAVSLKHCLKCTCVMETDKKANINIPRFGEWRMTWE